ncbi:hypothetical protein [Streptomyces pseudovenezuelae]|uniref:Uncharacterized protein n=1 Tax=Streptomyces pseudovenezuelae TaxID=67350 RepID=A0ABZ1X8H0_9ACTN|nr:hypothetical protein [Streptomyces pseudovenezuelae]
MTAMIVGVGDLVAVCRVAAPVRAQSFRKVEQGEALIVSRTRGADVASRGE